MVSTYKGQSIPLLYPSGMMFSSIAYKTVPLGGSIAGILSSFLLSANNSTHGFAPVDHHLRSSLTNPGVATSTNPKYIAFCYDTLTNLTLNKEDSRIILNRGLTVSPDGLGIVLRSKKDSRLADSIDSKTMVKNLCSSQKCHLMNFFLTFTCNKAKHFCISLIKNYIDSKRCEKNYPKYNELFESEK